MSRVTTKDEKQPSGAIMRCFYIDGEMVSRLHSDSRNWEVHRRELEQRYGTKAEKEAVEARQDDAPDPRYAKRGNREAARRTGLSEPEVRRTRRHVAAAEPPKSKERLAREDLYGACLAKKVYFDAADALAAEVGVVEATRLIRAHGPDSAWVSMASRFWADRGVKTAPSIPRSTSEVVGEQRATAAYERRAQALEPGRADESMGDVFGSEGHARSVYASREVAR